MEAVFLSETEGRSVSPYETEEKVTLELMEKLSAYCDEFLIHAVDVEGQNKGIEQELVSLLGGFTGKALTYAGGVHSMDDLQLIKTLGQDRLNVTIGSALELFGGQLRWEDVLAVCTACQ